MAERKVKFSSQAQESLLSEMREVAQSEGRQFQAVLEEAMIYYLDNRQFKKARSSVMGHFHSSVLKNRRLAELLAQ